MKTTFLALIALLGLAACSGGGSSSDTLTSDSFSCTTDPAPNCTFDNVELDAND